MLLKVDHDELEKVCDNIRKDGDYLFKEIETMSNELENLKNVWQGEDADSFYANFSSYLNKLGNIPKYLGVVDNFINKINNKYTENDEAFSKELDTEVDNYEQDINN